MVQLLTLPFELPFVRFSVSHRDRLPINVRADVACQTGYDVNTMNWQVTIYLDMFKRIVCYLSHL